MTKEQALNKAAAYCAHAERAPKDVEQKLRDWGMDDDDMDDVMKRLRDDHFVDEERYAHAFINDKFEYEHWGRIKIAFALRQKGISQSLINNTMDDVIDPEKYENILQDLLKSRMKGMALPLAQNDRARLFRFAQQRGFEYDMIIEAVGRVSKM
ncbi:MAG: RecX family transcriptional regulator [Bacteroidales bacterium]|nr:RecX family transcriptional regulator [Candidatus Liminaster caballi]